MKLKNNLHLSYCTNIHRGETWAETFDGLREYTNEVRQRVSPKDPFGIGLRLSAVAAGELSGDQALRDEFKQWLDDTNSYVFTINGFPYGTFHGDRVKEQVYVPDWSDPKRLAYTKQLFDLLDEFAPPGEPISVSTLPGSFKEFIKTQTAQEQMVAMYENLRACSDHITEIRKRSGRDVHLGLEPEPFGLFENSYETVAFFEGLTYSLDETKRAEFLQNVGVNYDTCHFAIEYESATGAINNLVEAGIRISKVHLSSALRLEPSAEAIESLLPFEDDIYLHQVVAAEGGEIVSRFRDLDDAFAAYRVNPNQVGDEWRVHFHVPIHGEIEAPLSSTREHISDLVSLLAENPEICQHFEMETYTWEVMPGSMQSRNVVDQLVGEYEWCLAEFRKAGLA